MPITEQTINLQMNIPVVYATGDNWEDKDTEYWAYHPANTVDHRLNSTGTRWDSDSVGQYMILALPSVTIIRDIWILWFKGYERKYRFKIEVSEDKSTWTTIFDGYSNEAQDTTGKYDDHVFVDPVGNKLIGNLTAQFIKITNVDGAYNFTKTTRVTHHSSIYDIVIYGHPTNEVYAYSA